MLEQAKLLLPSMIAWRRELHRNAELSFVEYQTQRFVGSVLNEYGISWRKVAGTGLLAVIDSHSPDALCPVVLRSDMDALPIVEATGLDFACADGAMHACGHDMHMAALMGALVLLNSNKDKWDGTVWGLFQPGEELHPGGASVVLAEGVFDKVEPRYFVGQHCSPELEVGQLGFHSGVFMASTDELHMTIHGRGGHAAQPHMVDDTVLASAAVIVALQQVSSRLANPLTPTVLSIGRVVADGATNIIPSEVYLEGTLRTMDEPWRAQAKGHIRRIATTTAASYGCTAEVEIKDGYPCVDNDKVLTDRAVELARELFGAQAAVMIPKRMTAEDFGFYAARYPAVFYRLGTGAGAPLHNAAFSADEHSLAYGAAMLASSTRL